MKSQHRRQGPAARRRRASDDGDRRALFVGPRCLWIAVLFLLAWSPLTVVGQHQVFEEPFEQAAPDVRRAEPDGRIVPHRPRVAILIDDMGLGRHVCKELPELPLHLSFSFFPHGPASMEQAEHAHRLGRDVLLHQPMQPRNPTVDPGPGALLLGLDETEVDAIVRANLAAIPHVVGVNNHMGSRYTEDRPAMRSFLRLLREQNLFFVDSFTSPRSIALEEAQALGLPTARRQIFLDNVLNPERVCQQIRALINEANVQGEAIGIGHPHEATLLALRQCGEQLQHEVELVGVRALVHRPPQTADP